MITKTQVNKIIIEYCKENNISKKEYSLFPLYIHLDGFSHSIGFINERPKKDTRYCDYISVAYSGYTCNSWGAENDHQRTLAIKILATIPHYCYKHNAKEILF